MALAAPRTTLAPPQGGAALHGSQAPDLSDILAAADRIDPLPVSVTRLALLVGDANADIREIVEVITYDQSLAANLLRQVNSAALGGRVKITTVHDAVMRLGIGTLFTLALGASVRTAMGQAIPSFGLAEGELWRHSVAASLAADIYGAVRRVRCPDGGVRRHAAPRLRQARDGEAFRGAAARTALLPPRRTKA